MSKKKLVLISGLLTAGKTTTSHELIRVLPGWIFIDIWKIKEMFEPLELENREQIIEISKKAMLMITKEVMKKTQRNIILQEAKQDFIKNNLGKEIKKYNYKVYSFFLDVNLKDAIKRDIKREKPTIGIKEKKWSAEEWKEKGKTKAQKCDVVINTSEKNTQEVIEIILKEIKEKSKKHLYPHWNKLKKTY